MSDAQTIQFELVSPEEKLVSEPVRMVVIPGEEGEMGIGAQHASIVASLKPGVVALYKDGMDKVSRKIFITGGFADVTGANCTVLAEEAIDVAKLDTAKLEQDLRNLDEDLKLAKDAGEVKRIERSILMTKAKISAVSGKIAA
ncbi:MAG: ATP synthase F1 subunit epsilon [Alphaproteobacteria bacterium]